jgi:hypothetical protein
VVRKCLRFAARFVLLCALDDLGLEGLDSAAGFVKLLEDKGGLRILDSALGAAEELA